MYTYNVYFRLHARMCYLNNEISVAYIAFIYNIIHILKQEHFAIIMYICTINVGFLSYY